MAFTLTRLMFRGIKEMNRDAPAANFAPMNQPARDSERNRKASVLCCLVTVVAAIVITVVLVVVLKKQQPNSDQTNSRWHPQMPTHTTSDKPSSPGSDIASDIISTKSRHTYTHPCNDFYEYACGGWVENNPASGYKRNNRFSSVRDNVLKVLTGELEKGVNLRDPEAVRKAKTFYQSCMDESTINRRDADPVKPVLSEVGEWSMVNSQSNTDGFDVVDAMIKMSVYRVFPLGIFEVITDPKNSSRTLITMDQPHMPFRHMSYTSRPAHISYINKVANIVRGYDNYDPDDRADSVISLQVKIAGLTRDTKDRPDIEGRYHIYRLGNLNTAFPLIDWKRVLSGIFSRPEVNITLSDDEPILVLNPTYFSNIGENIRWESSRTKSDYMGWAFIKGMLPFLSQELRMAESVVYEAIHIKLVEAARSKTCTEIIDMSLANMTGRILIDKEFDPEGVKMAQEMVTDIRKVFRETLQASDWMDNTTRETAIEKLDAIEELIGYPKEIMDDAVLNEQYEDLTFQVGNYFENAMEMIKYYRFCNLRLLHKPTSRLRWQKGPTTVNAFYDPEKNIIVVPAGILREPFFNKKFPRSMIYSRLGLVIGHELTHGFDNTGRKFDKEGNLDHWWTPVSLNRYNSKTKCFDRQYSNYLYPGLSKMLNGTRTLGENIADNGGLKHAHRAYREYVSRLGKEEIDLPSLHMTHNQVFYITFAQLWCETETDVLAKLLVDSASATHSPGKLRVLGTLQNNQHFADTFECKVGNDMDPSLKCLLW